MPKPGEKISRARLHDLDEEDEEEDPRFLHIMMNDEGADLSRKFFKNTEPGYLM